MSTSEDETKITAEELYRLSQECLGRIREGDLYNLRNDAKLRAVTNTSSYEEFKNIVDAAHLTSLSKDDKKNAHTKNRLWNSAAQCE